jgi:hypothetical protein
MVSCEELCELASVLSDDKKTRSKIIEEMADVNVCMNHINMMFNLNPEKHQKLVKLFSTTVFNPVKELCDFACLLTKYPRYPDHDTANKEIGEKVIVKSAWMVVIFDTLINLYSIQPSELDTVIEAKVKRLQRWLNSSPNMVQTTIDRDLTSDHRTYRSGYPEE